MKTDFRFPNVCFCCSITDGGKAWQEAGIFPSTRNIIITGLTSGTVYTVHIRAVGGSTQYSPWSATISLMVT